MTPGDLATAGDRNSVLILGGGASGVILAAQLLRSTDPDLRVTIVERRAEFGRGQAYSTTLPDHTLNVSAGGMSAFADDPDHFFRWLRDSGHADSRDYFAPRSLYGAYLGSILEELRQREPDRLKLVRADVERVIPSPSDVAAQLADGSGIVARKAVLAFGHGDPQHSVRPHAIRFDGPDDTAFDVTRDVLVLGSGLSMIDAWLSLQNRGHTGRMIAVSRRGLIPLPHGPGAPICLESGAVAFGADLSGFIRWLRGFIRAAERRGGSWRDVVDGLRPHNQRIWQSWPPQVRRRFLRHAKAWWDIHRHRMPPHIYARIAAAMESGQLRLVAGRVRDIQPAAGGYSVSIGLRRSKTELSLDVARIYDCTGVAKSVAEGSNSALRSLFESGYARLDPLGIGLDVTDTCAVTDADGSASDRLYAVGPLTRGQFYEIEAVPDIRIQCAVLARQLSCANAAS